MGDWKLPLWGCFDDIGMCKLKIGTNFFESDIDHFQIAARRLMEGLKRSSS